MCADSFRETRFIKKNVKVGFVHCIEFRLSWGNRLNCRTMAGTPSSTDRTAN